MPLWVRSRFAPVVEHVRSQVELLCGKRCRVCSAHLSGSNSGLCAAASCQQRAAIDQAFNGI